MPKRFENAFKAMGGTMSVRTATDKGEIDGYFGLLDMSIEQANPASFKKIETPEGMRTTLRVGVITGGFQWRCIECGASEETKTFKRPLHTCDPKILGIINELMEVRRDVSN
jgi:hypothetical protein